MILNSTPSTGSPSPESLSVTLCLSPWPSKFQECLCDHRWSCCDLDTRPFDLRITQDHQCLQLHLSCKSGKIPTSKIYVHRLLVDDHTQTHAQPQNRMPSAANRQQRHKKSQCNLVQHLFTIVTYDLILPLKSTNFCRHIDRWSKAVCLCVDRCINQVTLITTAIYRDL